MWTCPKCNEQIGDEFNSCWKCAGAAQPPPASGKIKKPFEQFEMLCLMIAFLPGIIFFTRGRAQNPEQAAFRIASIVIFFILGIGSYAAIKIYQKRKAGK